MANVSIMGGSAALLEAISVEINGTYYPDEGYDGFSAVTVDVPLGTKTITQNGIYNAGDDNLAGYSRVTVNQPQPVLVSKQITQNGTYYASSDNANGYNIVDVNVPTGTPSYGMESFKASNTFTSDVYTANHNERVLAINIEIIGEAGTGHTTNPTISTTGTLIDDLVTYTTYGSNDNRDCTVSLAIIDLDANETITFGNISRDSYINKIHVIVPFGNNYTSISNTLFDTITDSARDNSKNVTIPAGFSMAIAAGVRGASYYTSGDISGTSITGSALSDLITYDHMTVPYNDVVIGFFNADTAASATMNTSAETNYASKIYGIWSFSTV